MLVVMPLQMTSDTFRIPNLKDKVAVVTGASRGIGRGIALVLGEAGATVYVTGRSNAGQHDRKSRRQHRRDYGGGERKGWPGHSGALRPYSGCRS